MRAFSQIVVFLFALIVCVFAAEENYDTTVYVTSTVYRVNTVTVSGSHTGDAHNQTSTISAAYSTYPAGNATTKAPTGASSTAPPAATFTGAASSLNANAIVAALVAGVGYLAL